MAEFGMKHSHSSSSFGQASGMDWYTPGGSSAYAGYQQPSHTAYMPVSAPAYGGGSGGDGSLNFADEPPLLEELGIDLGGILKKTRAVLFHRLNSNITQELDMGGALLFVFVLGGLHLLYGKLHFGIILGWSVVHAAVLWFLVNQLAGVDAAEAKGLDLYSMCCLVGYCLAPLALCSALSLMLPRGILSIGLGVLCTLWAAITAAHILVRRAPALEDFRLVIAFPCTLLFSAFTLLSLY